MRVAVTPRFSDTSVPSEQDPDEALRSAKDQITQLQSALRHARLIGTAVGMLTERYEISPDAAFDLLAAVSQRTHRKVYDIAAQLVHSGELPDTPQKIRMPRLKSRGSATEQELLHD
ncbi:ANTAR domain-containing protein [Pseudonocardiaceae bacterium YIM PH 21723]|nr:ANTAR domain-containing protein [Pseudonocardiaceae bacterium YIM PH 21723]